MTVRWMFVLLVARYVEFHASRKVYRAAFRESAKNVVVTPAQASLDNDQDEQMLDAILTPEAARARTLDEWYGRDVTCLDEKQPWVAELHDAEQLTILHSVDRRPTSSWLPSQDRNVFLEAAATDLTGIDPDAGHLDDVVWEEHTFTNVGDVETDDYFVMDGWTESVRIGRRRDVVEDELLQARYDAMCGESRTLTGAQRHRAIAEARLRRQGSRWYREWQAKRVAYAQAERSRVEYENRAALLATMAANDIDAHDEDVQAWVVDQLDELGGPSGSKALAYARLERKINRIVAEREAAVA